MEAKKLIRTIQLCVAHAELGPGDELDESMITQVDEARYLMATLRGADVISGIVALRRSGLDMAIGITQRATPADQPPKSSRL